MNMSDEGDLHKKFETPKPVTVGDLRDVTIESQGGHGDGIAKIEGFVVFVKGASRGESCKVRITDVKRTFATAEKVQHGDVEERADDDIEGSKGGPSG
jgi:23S rRNA (uridine2552-2'-O)-methyltransferase